MVTPRLLLRERRVVGEGQFAEVVIWDLTESVPGSSHQFKYRLAHSSMRFAFVSITKRAKAIWTAIEAWRPDEQG
jgi:hypothetical protein